MLDRKFVSTFLHDLFDLKPDAEKESQTITSVKKSIPFKGFNLWILMFAIVIASIGLNINSTAIIIGAMLISPLMGPIVGTGLALGINDFKMLKDSLYHLSVASIIGIVVSAIYFYISPLREAQSELLARTAPTIYDVLVAFFGGAAGIIGASRKEKGNVIPGVAIATALMPPLCTVGYGLATGQFSFFWGSLYLYLINCTFICIATYVIVKYFGFKSVTRLEGTRSATINRSIIFITILMILPATNFAYRLSQKNKFENNVNRFIKTEFVDTGCTILLKKVSFDNSHKKIELAFLAKRFTPQEVDSLSALMTAYGIKGAKLEIKQNLNELTTNDFKSVSDRLNVESSRVQQLEDQMLLLNKKGQDINKQLLKELGTIDTTILSVSIGELPVVYYNDKKLVALDTVFTVGIKHNPNIDNNKSIKELKEFLKARLSRDSIAVHFLD